MARFEIGTYAKVIATGRIGEVTHRERTRVTIEFFDKSSINPETCEFKDHELMLTELPQMKTSQLEPFVRGEISLTELTDGVHILPEYVKIDSKAYKVTAKDLLAGARHYEGMSSEDILRWLDPIMMFEDDMSFPSEPWADIQDAVTEKDFLSYIRDEMANFLWAIWDGESEKYIREDIKNIREQLEQWINSDGKEYPEEI